MPSNSATDPEEIEFGALEHWADSMIEDAEKEDTPYHIILKLVDRYRTQRATIESLERQVFDHHAATQCLEKENQAQAEEIERLKKACEIYKRGTYQSHNGHWDSTMQSGRGCPECIAAIECREQAEQALRGEP